MALTLAVVDDEGGGTFTATVSGDEARAIAVCTDGSSLTNPDPGVIVTVSKAPTDIASLDTVTLAGTGLYDGARLVVLGPGESGLNDNQFVIGVAYSADVSGGTYVKAGAGPDGPRLLAARWEGSSGTVTWTDLGEFDGGDEITSTVGSAGRWAFVAVGAAERSSLVSVLLTAAGSYSGRTVAVAWEPGGGSEQVIELAEGEDLTLSFSPDSDTNISLYAIRFTAADDWGESATVTKAEGTGVTITSAATGTFTVTLSAATFDEGQYVWEVERTDSGAHTRLAFGRIVVVDDIVS